MSDTCTYIADSARARNDGRALDAHPEPAILDLIGDTIGPRYPVGSASRWHRRARSVAEKRIAEYIASVVHHASGDDPIARRVGITAAGHVAEHPPALLRELIAAAIGRAAVEIDGDIAEVTRRRDAIRATRTRPALAEIARQRKAGLPELRHLDSEVAGLRADIERGRSGADGPAGRYAAKWCKARDLPRLELRAAELRASLPSYRLPPRKRERLAAFADRLRRLRAARRALRAELRRIGGGRPRPLGAA